MGIQVLKTVILLTAWIIFFSPVHADHGPKKMWKRGIQPYFTAHQTGKLGPFDVAIQSFGKTPSGGIDEIQIEQFDRIFNDKHNLATIVRKNDEVVYVRFNEKLGINALTPMHGMSMSKTALGAAVGSLVCTGEIQSLDDPMGQYSISLRNTPYKDVTIRNVL